MPTDHRVALAAIRRFDQLIAYLRDEMDWPITRDSFDDVDDLFFEFTPEELGIDTKNAAKIQEIRRLRPLSTHQPWGIFFVKFEPKQLPVVALRRILSRVSLKKRASANSAERAAWSADDLLFISNYGEGERRQISFAHFSQNEAKKDLPTLKVLGWDNLDTPLHLDHVAEYLTERLAWPDNEEDPEAWRSQWRAAFNIVHREIITTSKKLSTELAALARNIRDRINTVLAIETNDGPVSKLMAAFKEALVHDLDEDGFADMYAQTIAYGLLSARITNPRGDTADDFVAQIPITNPFLKDLMKAFFKAGGRMEKAEKGTSIDFDELGVSEVIELLDNPETKMEDVIRDFGDRNPQEDPVIHFYELFLEKYDARKRRQRGVFYTPRPVVSFIVRSVDELLRTEFGLEDGLADTTTWGEMLKRYPDLSLPVLRKKKRLDRKSIEITLSPDAPFVQILDPATGTGTFLAEVIGLIHKTMTEKWQAKGQGKKKIEQLWNNYVPAHLLPRLHGYELMMAPYAIAHMKIGLKLYETGYSFDSDERVRIYLTNSLEPGSDMADTTAASLFGALGREAQAVNEIKRDQRFTVVIGNPPYAAVSSNLTEHARAMVDPYRVFNDSPIVERGALQFEKNLNDDYVKFLRFAESTIEQSSGIVGFICNNGYLETPTLRGMREHLANTFAIIDLMDLHGDTDRREKAPDGSLDQNVFDIKRGVAIGLFRRVPGFGHGHSIRRVDLFGSREEKYRWLQDFTGIEDQQETFCPLGSLFLFRKQEEEILTEYSAGIAVDELFSVGSSGFESGRDEILIDFTRQELSEKLRFFSSGNPDDVRASFSVSKAWGEHLFDKRVSILADEQFNSRIMPVLMYPFDLRWCFFRKDLLKTNSWSAGQHLRNRDNIALMCMRQVVLDEPYTHVGVSSVLVNNRAFASQKGKVAYYPLFLNPEYNSQLLGTTSIGTNIDNRLACKLLNYFRDTQDIARRTLYLFIAQAFSTAYRIRYRDHLSRGFPRLFRTKTKTLENELIRLGSDIVALQLLDPDYPYASWNTVLSGVADGCSFGQSYMLYEGSSLPTVEKVSYSDETVWLDKAKTRGFRGVPEEVWNFKIGGYQVCHKWLKDRQAKGGKNPRPGRVLTDEDIDHYQKIVVALSETIRIMAEIDKVIEKHGGWPDAFQNSG